MNNDKTMHGNALHDSSNDDTLPDALRWSLRGLRRDVAPEHDLWSGIALRIAQAPASSQPVADRRHRRWNGAAPLAIAASLVFAVGVAWQLRPVSPQAGASQAANLAHEAAAMTREYDAALSEVATPDRADFPALRELDRSAAAIRTALTRDPDARFLLDRLRHTYERRLALTQRIALI
ncbi:MAG: hypothetical protein M3Q96_04005 [Pseudomonadota bacterium]|nr:hypothetical protein [Pseudomonadota bacterium]